ncbi:hypothetical protein F1880_003305 [Penicillium rolfsii]|nr:hypothetical protein F1880_003305 [Penicillium rolfsii]
MAPTPSRIAAHTTGDFVVALLLVLQYRLHILLYRLLVLLLAHAVFLALPGTLIFLPNLPPTLILLFNKNLKFIKVIILIIRIARILHKTTIINSATLILTIKTTHLAISILTLTVKTSLQVKTILTCHILITTLHPSLPLDPTLPTPPLLSTFHLLQETYLQLTLTLNPSHFPARWFSDEEGNRVAQAAIDDFLDNCFGPTVEAPIDPVVERAPKNPLNSTIPSEHISPDSPPFVVPRKRVRQRVRKNKHGRKRAKKCKKPKMGSRSSDPPPPSPSEGSTGIASSTCIAETVILAADADNVHSPPPPSECSIDIASSTSIAETMILAADADNIRSPPPSPTPSPTQGMTPLPAAQGPVNQAPPKRKKKKGRNGKKGKREVGQASGKIPGPSSDAQLTDSVSPAPETVVSLVGATSELETPPACTVSTGQDGGSPISESPSATVVDSGGEATTGSSAPVKEYTGPCIVDTERWRQRTLARISEMDADAKRVYEARKSVGLHDIPFDVGEVFPHSVNQSENSWAHWPMEGQLVPAQYSHHSGYQTGYAQPVYGVVPGASGVGLGCGFYSNCHHHHDQGGPRRSCCCLHGPADCWYVAPAPTGPVASQEQMFVAASPAEARRESQLSSPKSSSLGEPVSEPVVESVASLLAAGLAASTDEVPFMNFISTPVNAKKMGGCQAYPGGVPTPDDLISPSLYFDAISKSMNSSASASNQSKPSSRDISRKPSPSGSHGPETTQTGHPNETRSQGCQTVPPDTRHQSSQTEAAAGPLAFQMEYFQALFGNPEFADIQLLLSPDPFQRPVVYNLHKAIIAGSPFLYSVMAAKRYRDGYVDHINAFTGPSFTCSHAFTVALQTLYGTPLVTDETFRQSTLQGPGISDDYGMGRHPFSIERAMVDFALCYAAAGAFLARREITERGIDMAISHLSWETAELILAFGMTPLTYMVTCPDVPFPPISPATSDASSPCGDQGPGTPVVGIDHFHDFLYVQAERAQTAALRFITNAVKPDFQLYRRAQACYTPSRIPPALHTLPGSLLSNPRLEELRFGDLPSLADERPTDPAILVPSAMLITLPYRVFMMALEIMKSRGNLRSALINEIVEERESRRLMALRISIGVSPLEIAPEAFAELEYREFVKMESTDHVGDNNARVSRATVDRVWVGPNVPESSLLGPFGRSVPSRRASFAPSPLTSSNAA